MKPLLIESSNAQVAVITLSDYYDMTYHIHYCSKDWDFFFLSILCSPGLHLFDENKIKAVIL